MVDAIGKEIERKRQRLEQKLNEIESEFTQKADDDDYPNQTRSADKPVQVRKAWLDEELDDFDL